jgi:hypothetical protein
MRQKLFDILSSNGYERKFEQFSACDDWYVQPSDITPPSSPGFASVS